MNSPCLIWWAMFAWCPPAPLTPIVFSSLSFMGFPHLQGKEPHGDLQFRLFPLVTSGSESLHLLPAAGGSLSGDDCTCGRFPHSSLNVERLRFCLQKLTILKFLQVFICLCGSPSCMPPMCPREHVELRGY